MPSEYKLDPSSFHTMSKWFSGTSVRGSTSAVPGRCTASSKSTTPPIWLGTVFSDTRVTAIVLGCNGDTRITPAV